MHSNIANCTVKSEAVKKAEQREANRLSPALFLTAIRGAETALETIALWPDSRLTRCPVDSQCLGRTSLALSPVATMGHKSGYFARPTWGGDYLRVQRCSSTLGHLISYTWFATLTFSRGPLRRLSLEMSW